VSEVFTAGGFQMGRRGPACRASTCGSRFAAGNALHGCRVAFEPGGCVIWPELAPSRRRRSADPESQRAELELVVDGLLDEGHASCSECGRHERADGARADQLVVRAGVQGFADHAPRLPRGRFTDQHRLKARQTHEAYERAVLDHEEGARVAAGEGCGGAQGSFSTLPSSNSRASGVAGLPRTLP
jgi:hypothetical protein